MDKRLRDCCAFGVAVAGIVLCFMGVARLGYTAGRDDVDDDEEVVETISLEEEVEPANIVIDSVVLPEDYILTVDFGTAELVYDTEITKLIYNSDGSYVAETSLGNKIIFDDGTCIIEHSDNLIEVFTEYSFIPKYRKGAVRTSKEADYE